jgi:hypothetical protein
LQLAEEDDGETGDDAYLTVRDLLDISGNVSWQLPERILLLACSTLGVVVGGDASGGRTARPPLSPALWPLAGEWVGFSAACLVAGARVVVCTHFDQVDDAKATSMDHRMTRMLELSGSPVHALSAMQRETLSAWRTGYPGCALTHMCYTIVTIADPSSG